MTHARLAASILAADLVNLSKSVHEASDAGVDLIHIDIADGVFAPNITFGAGTVAAIRLETSLELDTHLMVANPENHLEAFIRAGSDILTVHIEACNANNIRRMVRVISKEGRKMGLAIKPATRLPNWIVPFLDKLYLINVMAVEPGFSGQSFNNQILPKLKDYAKRFLSINPNLEFEVDGGVGPENARTLVDAGASILVAGASIYIRGEVRGAVRKLRESVA